MVLFRSAVKQICRRHGYHATFMCRPHLPNVMSSGWHLHQSLRDRESGSNAFVPARRRDPVAGRPALSRRPAASTPRAARRVHHADDQRLQALPRPIRWRPTAPSGAATIAAPCCASSAAPGDPATRLENRVGEPAANPYLYMASQIVCGPRRHGAQARSRRRRPTRPTRPRRRLLPRTSRRGAGGACAATRASARDSATRSSTTSAASRKPRSRASSSKCQRVGTARVFRLVLTGWAGVTISRHVLIIAAMPAGDRHPDMAEARHDGDREIGPAGQECRRKFFGIEQLVGAADQKRHGLVAAAAARPDSRDGATEIDREAERIPAGQRLDLGRGRERDDRQAVEPVDADAMETATTRRCAASPPRPSRQVRAMRRRARRQRRRDQDEAVEQSSRRPRRSRAARSRRRRKSRSAKSSPTDARPKHRHQIGEIVLELADIVDVAAPANHNGRAEPAHRPRRRCA